MAGDQSPAKHGLGAGSCLMFVEAKSGAITTKYTKYTKSGNLNLF